MNHKMVYVAYEEISKNPGLSMDEKKELITKFLEGSDPDVLSLIRDSKSQVEMDCHLLAYHNDLFFNPEKEVFPELKNEFCILSSEKTISPEFLEGFDKKASEFYSQDKK